MRFTLFDDADLQSLPKACPDDLGVKGGTKVDGDALWGMVRCMQVYACMYFRCLGNMLYILTQLINCYKHAHIHQQIGYVNQLIDQSIHGSIECKHVTLRWDWISSVSQQVSSSSLSALCMVGQM